MFFVVLVYMALKDVLLYLIFILKKTSKQTQINKKPIQKNMFLYSRIFFVLC